MVIRAVLTPLVGYDMGVWRFDFLYLRQLYLRLFVWR